MGSTKCKLVNIIHHIERLKNKSHMINSLDIEKSFDNIQPPLVVKALERLRIQGTNLNRKVFYSKLITNIKLNRNELKIFSTTIRNKSGMSTLPIPIKIVPDVLATAIRQLKDIKGIQLERTKSKYLYLQMLCFYTLKSPKTVPENLFSW